MHGRAALALLIAAALALQGCAAALVPAAAAGLAARRRAGQSHVQASSPQVPRDAAPRPTPDVAGDARLGHDPAPGVALERVPADPATMQPGKLYLGALPDPRPASPRDDAGPVSTTPAAAAGGTSAMDPVDAVAEWNDVSRYIGARFAQASADSVLLMPGSTLAAPRWVSCGDKPLAMLVDLDAVVSHAGSASARAAAVLGAAETLQIAVVYLARRADAAASFPALVEAGLHRPESGNVVSVTPGREASVRASVAARYCVVAIAGDRAEDFPNAATPRTAGERWNPGWFLLPAADDASG